jgi:hypothetical protein
MKPYGYVRKDGQGLFIYGEHQFQNATDAELVPVYLHPKEWVGLTDEDKHEIELRAGITEDDDGYIVSQVFKLTEAKLKEKNA